LQVGHRPPGDHQEFWKGGVGALHDDAGHPILPARLMERAKRFALLTPINARKKFEAKKAQG
jgi:hypothetical protein